MRNALALLFLPVAVALAAPDVFADFVPPLPGENPLAQNNDTVAEQLDLLKRQTGCATGYQACSNLNAPGLCCRTNQVCSADAANHVACCPTNAACTGTIAPVSGASASPTTTSSPFVLASTTSTTAAATATTTTGTFVQSGSASYSRSTVPNSYYPFAFIPTTYTNAAACSSAYTSCNSDATSCYAALASGRQGVTVTAPNGGATITAISSLGTASASSICSSLSSLGCYNLNVAACSSFGGGSAGGAPRTRCAGEWYGMGVGVAVGIAGQLLR